VTYPDGSSIIVGIGDNSEIWMQKLDPNGYKQWLPYISVFPSISGLRYFLPDGDGGIYAIIGSVAQRVDKNGNLRWGTNGKTIITPGTNLHRVVSDGMNGFIAIYNRFDSLQRTTVFRYDSSGAKLWEKEIDTSTVQNSFFGDIIGRLGEKALLYSSKSGFIFLQMNGETENTDSIFFQGSSFVTEKDSVGFNVQILPSIVDTNGNTILRNKIIKLSMLWDTIWTVVVQRRSINASFFNVGVPYLPDQTGGLFFFSSYYDSINNSKTRVLRIDQKGYIWGDSGLVMDGLAGRQFFSAKGKIGFVTDRMFSQILDTNMNVLWPDSFSVIQDYDNTYFVNATSDNLGGAILSFWTVAGGIKVQHTGRVGKVGVLTKIIDYRLSVAESFELSQNYPNPFNPVTTITYALPQDGMVTLKIYDALGRETSTLVKEYKQSGRHTVSFSAIGGSASGGDATGLSSGVYFYKLVSGKFTAIRKMILIK
jgi:hypothetical protein